MRVLRLPPKAWARGLHPIVSARHENIFWLEARPFRFLARLGQGLPNVQSTCIARIQVVLRDLFHGDLQSSDGGTNWNDLKRVGWFLTRDYKLNPN
jgi:hypothetical protein